MTLLSFFSVLVGAQPLRRALEAYAEYAPLAGPGRGRPVRRPRPGGGLPSVFEKWLRHGLEGRIIGAALLVLLGICGLQGSPVALQLPPETKVEPMPAPVPVKRPVPLRPFRPEPAQELKRPIGHWDRARPG